MADFEIRKEPLSLELHRLIDAPRDAVWRCWTEPDLLKQWFCPQPWSVPHAEFDLRPGGRMTTVMQGPTGERMENQGVWLEIVPQRRLTFTDAYSEGFVPTASPFMTGFVELSDAGDGATRMVWGARHASEEDTQKHLDMGFEQGWPIVADQLEQVARELGRTGSAPAGNDKPPRSKLRTCLFLKDAEAAANFYVSLLPDSRIESVVRPEPTGPALVVEFTLAGAPYMSLAGNPDPVPSHISSISVLTADQSETDTLWAALLADGGEAGQCGWVKDRFGVHWQVVPDALPRLMSGGDADSAMRVQSALRSMKKIDIAQLEAAFAGN